MKSDLIHICRAILQVKVIKWEDDSLDLIPESSGDATAYIEMLEEKGQFKYRYEIYLSKLTEPLTKRKQIDWLVKVSNVFQTEILTEDEEPDPFTFIYIEPDGQVSTVDVDTDAYNHKEELNIHGIYNFCFGSFSTETVVTKDEQNVLDTLLRDSLPDYDCVMNDLESMNNDFSRNKDNFASLMHYKYNYFIVPRGKSCWFSKDEKSVLLVDIMAAFHAETKKNVCVFPANANTTKNIPGGSDYEAYCINIHATGREKIIYKARRERW